MCPTTFQPLTAAHRYAHNTVTTLLFYGSHFAELHRNDTGSAVESLKRVGDEASAYDELFWQDCEVPLHFDVSVAKEWLQNCQAHHSDCRCEAPHEMSFAITLIDCITFELHRTKVSEQYAALSYVWGGVAQPPLQNGRVPSDASKVVLDAITVTQKLGLRYLWWTNTASIRRIIVPKKSSSPKWIWSIVRPK